VERCCRLLGEQQMIITDLTTPEQPEEYNNILSLFKAADRRSTVNLTTRQIAILAKHTHSNMQQIGRNKLLPGIANQEAFGHPIKEVK